MRILDTPLPYPIPPIAERAGGFGLTGGVVPGDATARLAAPHALAVTTGQQPGLFTGPLYTIHKALSAVALARRLEQEWNRPVVPVFWLAGDDHDFAEASHAAWPGMDGVEEVTLRERPAEAALTPMYREPLGAEVEAALDRVEIGLPGAEFKPDTLAWLRRHYRPEATVAASFAGALAELLANRGLVFFDSTSPDAKRAMAPWLVRALRESAALESMLVERSARLVREGRDPGVPVGDGATLVMIEAGQGRDRLVRDGQAFLTRRSRERFTLAELEAIAEREPTRLSPNVLLRPVVESAILPTVAYVGGPGELRYLQLTTPLYEALGVVRQTPVPRWSGLLVEPRVDRVLQKFGITLDDLLAGPGIVETRVLREHLPPDALTTLHELRQALDAGYRRLATVATQVDPTLERPVESTRLRAQRDTDLIEKRLLQHQKRKWETELAQVTRARSAVAPLGKPQERVFGIWPYLARYGPGVLDELAGHITAWYQAQQPAGAA